jgi:hypothetical protein
LRFRCGHRGLRVHQPMPTTVRDDAVLCDRENGVAPDP